MDKITPLIKDEFEAAKAATDRSMDKVAAFSTDQIEKASASTAEKIGDMAEFNRSNAEAIVAASLTYMKGMEELRGAFIELVQAQCQSGIAASQALMRCKSLPTLAATHSEFTKNSIDRTLANGTKLTEIARKVAEETIAPIHQRITEAVKSMPKTIAA